MPEAMAMDNPDHSGMNGMTPEEHRIHMLLLGTALAAGAVMVAPYVLPYLGLGTTHMAGSIMKAVHGLNGGLAGGINTALGSLPIIGATLAKGGLWTAAAAGVTGIGGMLLSRYLEKRENGTTHIRWSRVIATAALVTSSLIAMPAALTSLTIGITYLSAALFGKAAGMSVLNSLASTLGVGGMSEGLGGIGGLLPHLLTCGAALLPASISWLMNGQRPTAGMHANAVMKMNHAGMSMALRPTGDIQAAITVDQPTKAHVPCEATLRLRHADGSPLTNDELAVTHTEKLHLFVTDQALKDYHHLHPKPTGEPGVFHFSFTPNSSNRYSAWVDTTTLRDGKEHVAKMDIASEARRNVTPSIRVNNAAEQNGLRFEWNMPVPLRQGEPGIVEVTVKDRQGRPVSDLKPVMGAFAHLVGFSADGSRILHAHPVDRMPAGADERGGPKLRFQLEPDQAGAMQFYLHAQRGGETIYVPFGQQIKASLSQPARPQRDHAHAAMAY